MSILCGNLGVLVTKRRQLFWMRCNLCFIHSFIIGYDSPFRVSASFISFFQTALSFATFLHSPGRRSHLTVPSTESCHRILGRSLFLSRRIDTLLLSLCSIFTYKVRGPCSSKCGSSYHP